MNSCVKYSIGSLYPNSKEIKNANIVYLINTIHLLGVVFIQFGILLPPQYLKYYILYLMLLIVTYFYFRNKCFMTILSNYYSGKYIKVLCIKLSQAKFILILYLLLAVIFYMEHSIAPYTLLNKLCKFILKK